MKICILSPSHKSFIKDFLPSFDFDNLPDGYDGAPFVGTLIKEFLQKGHTIIAITTSFMKENDFHVKTYKENNFTWVVVPQRKHVFRFYKSKPGRLLDFYRYERKEMLKHLKLEKPDFVHAHWGYEFAHVAIQCNLPYLVTIHDNPFTIAKYSKNLYRLVRLFYSEIIFKKIKFKSTVSPYMSEYASRFGGCLEIIPNPIKIKYNANHINELINSKINSLNNLKFFMISNGWSGRKNGINGLKAFRELSKKYSDAQLHLFGTGTEIGGPAEIDTQKLKINNVFFHGTKDNDELLSEIKNYHVLIHPALEESFGVVLIEAMSFGVLCIGGRNSGAVPWVIHDDRLLADVEDPASIVEIFNNCIGNYGNICYSSYLNVKDRFSTEIISQAYLKYYHTIIKKCQL